MATKAKFDWMDLAENAAGSFLGQKIPGWIDDLFGASKPTMRQNTDQMKQAYGRAFDEQEARIQSRLNQRGVSGPDVTSRAFAPLATQRAMAMATLDDQGNQAQYMDDMNAYDRHRQTAGSLLPYLFQYKDAAGATRPGILQYLWDQFGQPDPTGAPLKERPATGVVKSAGRPPVEAFLPEAKASTGSAGIGGVIESNNRFRRRR